MLSFHWTQGRYDNVVVVEAPDDQAVAASILASSRLGSVRTETMRAFNEGEMFGILQKV